MTKTALEFQRLALATWYADILGEGNPYAIQRQGFQWKRRAASVQD